MRRPLLALLLGVAAFAAPLAPHAAANPYCEGVGTVQGFGPVCTVKCLLSSNLSCLWEDQ